MDYRCVGLFDSPHSIVYGHKAKNGSMFGSLYRYLDAGYLAGHSEIRITKPDRSVDIWTIVSAYVSDIRDHSYRIDFTGPNDFAAFAKWLGAPVGTERILTLSTCTSGGTDEERMLVHAVLTGYSLPEPSIADIAKSVSPSTQATMIASVAEAPEAPAHTETPETPALAEATPHIEIPTPVEEPLSAMNAPVIESRPAAEPQQPSAEVPQIFENQAKAEVELEPLDTDVQLAEENPPIDEAVSQEAASVPISGGTNGDVLPKPSKPGHTVVRTEDGSVVEYDENGEYVGRWNWS